MLPAQQVRIFAIEAELLSLLERVAFFKELIGLRTVHMPYWSVDTRSINDHKERSKRTTGRADVKVHIYGLPSQLVW